MKTAVSVPDRLFEAIDRLARSEGRSRSAVYTAALRHYLAHHQPGEITEALDRVVEAVGAEPDQWVEATSRAVLEASEW